MRDFIILFGYNSLRFLWGNNFWVRFLNDFINLFSYDSLRFLCGIVSFLNYFRDFIMIFDYNSFRLLCWNQSILFHFFVYLRAFINLFDKNKLLFFYDILFNFFVRFRKSLLKINQTILFRWLIRLIWQHVLHTDQLISIFFVSFYG